MATAASRASMRVPSSKIHPMAATRVTSGRWEIHPHLQGKPQPLCWDSLSLCWLFSQWLEEPHALPDTKCWIRQWKPPPGPTPKRAQSSPPLPVHPSPPPPCPKNTSHQRMLHRIIRFHRKFEDHFIAQSFWKCFATLTASVLALWLLIVLHLVASSFLWLFVYHFNYC